MARPQIVPLMADITRLEVDAIVNAANSALLVGGGVDAAIHEGAKSMAFPAISTGIFGFPKELAANIAVNTLRGLSTRVGRVILAACGPGTMSIYERLLDMPVIADM